MLIRQLRVNESLILQDGIEVMVTSMGVRDLPLEGGWVKLGIRAPRDVQVGYGRKLSGTKPRRKP